MNMNMNKEMSIVFVTELQHTEQTAALSREVVLQNYDVGDVWLSVFSYSITFDNNSTCYSAY